MTVTLNTALNVSYEAAGVTWDGVNAVSAPRHEAGGRGVMVARVLHTFGHDVVAAGLAGGATGEMIRADLATSGIPAEFTWTGTESRRIIQLADTASGRTALFREAGPYITTEELGRFAADYRRLMRDATAAVLCGSLPAGLPTEIYATLATYAADAGVPVVVDAGGPELRFAVARRPALAVADPLPDPEALIAAGAGAVVVSSGDELLAVTPEGRWQAGLVPDEGLPGAPPGRGAPGTAQPSPAAAQPAPAAARPRPDPRAAAAGPAARGALVAGLVPGVLLGWSWPDQLRHAMALSASAARPAVPRTAGSGPAGIGGIAGVGPGPGVPGRSPASPAASSTAAQPAPVDLAAYERLVSQVRVERC